MRLVLDAMPLIYLSKAGFFRLLKGLDLELFTSEDVAKEVLLPEFSFRFPGGVPAGPE